LGTKGDNKDAIQQGLRSGRGSSSGATTRPRRMMKREPMAVLQGLWKRKERKRIY
jgi:hypothetical protein